ncbi:MAG: fumarylacetoacetate hydrolase family protein, partial [Gemmatimonas sp.]
MPNDPTVDPSLRSWVSSANTPGNDFPIQNLPFGVFKRAGTSESARVGVAIGDSILDVAACLAAALLHDASADARQGAMACASSSLNELMSRGTAPRKALRGALSEILSEGVSSHRRQVAEHALIAQENAKLFMPAVIGDYTDFYASVHHAANVGALFRPDQPLLPNYKWVPIGYHGRASSIVLSGTPVTRPHGQRKGPNDAEPAYGPSNALDYELELGAFVSTGNALGSPVPLSEADDHLFGLCLLNDWSARDIQSWEYQPLGP